jgi:hypothetical protein
LNARAALARSSGFPVRVAKRYAALPVLEALLLFADHPLEHRD